MFVDRHKVVAFLRDSGEDAPGIRRTTSGFPSAGTVPPISRTAICTVPRTGYPSQSFCGAPVLPSQDFVSLSEDELRQLRLHARTFRNQARQPHQSLLPNAA